MSRFGDLQKLVNMFSSGGMMKTAQGEMMMDPAMAGQMTGGPGMPMPGPATMPPMADPNQMMPPPVEAMVQAPPMPVGKNENDVAIKAMDLANKTIELVLNDQNNNPEDMSDQVAAILAGSKATDNIPAEDIAAMASEQQQADEQAALGEQGQGL